MKHSNVAVYALAEGRFINRFLETPLFEKREHFKKTIMGGKVNEWLKFGFAINDNPCRKEFIADKLAAKPTFPDLSGCVANEPWKINGEETTISLHMPYGNVSVDHSGFWRAPTSLVSYHIAWVESPCDQTMEFELSTCGGSTIWLNGEEVVCFRPFTRNMKKDTRFTAQLKSGLNELVVCQEDLAERDTDYYFRIEALSPAGLCIHLPVQEDVDTTKLQAVENMLNDACIHLDKKLEGKADIELINPLSEPVQMKAHFAFGDIMGVDRSESADGQNMYALQPGENHIVLKAEEKLSPSFCGIKLETKVGSMTLIRKLAAQLTRSEFTQLSAKTLAERKADLLDFAAYQAPENAYRAVALLEKNEDLALANSILRHELPGIRQHWDCSDFYLIAHLYALMYHREKLEADVIEAMEDAIFTFRYWIDEPGNDVMWFFSENHALLFHSCQYIAGRMFPDRVFEASGLTGRECEAKAAGLLDKWFNDFENEFMTEWNSNAYLPIDCTGFGFMLLMVDKEEPLYKRLCSALDRIFLCLTQYSLKNIFMSSYGRSYEKQLQGNYTNGPATLLYMGYGIGCITSHTGPFVPLCLSDYEPPVEYARYMRPGANQYLWLMNNQGYENHVNLTLYKTDRVLLSTANAFKPYKPGYQEHIVQAGIDADANCYISHPGETHPFGSGRPNYWAGNYWLPLAMQWKDVSVIRYRNPANSLVHYTHAFFPFEAFDRVLSGENWYCGEKDGGYIYLWAQNGLRRQCKGAYRLQELISDGLENCWVVRVGDSEDYETLEAFAKACECSVTDINENAVIIAMGDGKTVTLENDPLMLRMNGVPVEHRFIAGVGEMTIQHK